MSDKTICQQYQRWAAEAVEEWDGQDNNELWDLISRKLGTPSPVGRAERAERERDKLFAATEITSSTDCFRQRSTVSYRIGIFSGDFECHRGLIREGLRATIRGRLGLDVETAANGRVGS